MLCWTEARILKLWAWSLIYWRLSTLLDVSPFVMCKAVQEGWDTDPKMNNSAISQCFFMSVLNRDGIKLRSKNCHIWGGKTKEGLNLDIVPIFVFCLKVTGVGAVQKRTDSSLFYFLLRILSTVLNFCSTNTGACIISSEKQFEGNSCVMTSCLLWMEFI